MTRAIEEVKPSLNTRIITYEGHIQEYIGKRFVVDFGDLERQVAVMVFPEPSSIQSGEVPSVIHPELTQVIIKDPRYREGTIIYSKSKI